MVAVAGAPEIELAWKEDGIEATAGTAGIARADDRLLVEAIRQVLGLLDVSPGSDLVVLAPPSLPLGSALSGPSITHLQVPDARTIEPLTVDAPDDSFAAAVWVGAPDLAEHLHTPTIAELRRITTGPLILAPRPGGDRVPAPGGESTGKNALGTVAETAGASWLAVPLGHLPNRMLLASVELSLAESPDRWEQVLDWYLRTIAPYEQQAPATSWLVIVLDDPEDWSGFPPPGDPDALALAQTVLRDLAQAAAASALHRACRDLEAQRSDVAELIRHAREGAAHLSDLLRSEDANMQHQEELRGAHQVLTQRVLHQSTVFERALSSFAALQLPDPPAPPPPLPQPTTPPPQVLHELREWKRRAETAERRAAETRRQLRMALGSESMRVGRKVTAPGRALARVMRRARRS